MDELHHPSVKLPSEEELAFPDPESALVAAVRAIPAWTEPYLAYLLRGELLEDEVKQRQLIRRCKSYTVIDGELYKRSTTGVYQRCVCLQKKAGKSCKKSTQVIVVIMHPLDPWCQKLSGTGSFG